MVVGIILTVLLGTVTLGGTGMMDKEPTPVVKEYYGEGDWGNE